jgi:hypothetical protein
MAPASTEAAEKQLAEKEESHGLPKIDGMPAKDLRRQPVPQSHDQEAEERKPGYHHQRHLQDAPHDARDPFVIHGSSLILS